LFEEPGNGAARFFFRDELTGRSERAECGVGGDLFYGCGVAGGHGVALEVAAGDLESVEEEAGAFGVDVVAGDALQDFTDGVLDGAAVLGCGEMEAGLTATTRMRVGDGVAGGVMVVAELLGAEAWAAAAVAVGEDVAALKAFGCVGHGGTLLGT
jgi:hypothetical protein